MSRRDDVLSRPQHPKNIGSFRMAGIAAVFIVFVSSSSALADGLFTGFGGASLGSSQSEQVSTWGLSLAGMAGGIFGFELDFSRTAKAETDTVFVTNGRLTTLTGNVIGGIPLGGAVRPYVVGGVGWVRTDVASAIVSAQNDGLAVDFGGGLMGFFGDRVGARVDLRYFRAVSSGEDFFDFSFEDLDFIRVTAGVILKF